MSLFDTRYEKRSRLGGGDDAEVFHCWDRHLEQDVAVRVDPDAKRARRQWRSLFDAAGAGVVRVVDFHLEDGVALGVYELVSGTTYAAWLAKAPPPLARLKQLRRVIAGFRRLHTAKQA